MANMVFASQRDAQGNLVFEEQLTPETRALSATLSVSAKLTTSLKIIKFTMSSSLSSRTTVIADLSLIPSSFRANLTVRSALTTNLVKIESRLAAHLSVSSKVQAQLGAIVNPQKFLATSLKSSSGVIAQLFTTIDSNIPEGAVVKAVPSLSDKMYVVRYRGDTYADEFTVFDDCTGELVDITGCVLRLTLATKRNPKSIDQIVYTLTGIIDRTKLGTVYFAPTESQADMVGFYFYDIELREPQGVVRTLAKDRYIYKQDITP